MLILALDTSGKIASCALLRDGVLLGQEARDSMLDHSRLLLPLCQALLAEQGLTLEDVDVFAAVVGPGSFTGVRIGTAAVKGFSWAQDKPCVGVSSLLSMAWDGASDGVYCCSIAARREESYYALFRRENGLITRLTDDAVGPDAQMEALARSHGCTHFLRDCQRASGAARAAWQASREGRLQTCHEITPAYLRATQAERMRKEGLNPS